MLPAMRSGAPRRATAAHRDAVARTAAYVRRHCDAPIRIGELCDLTGFSERGLRSAFQRVCGMSPTRYVRIVRLGLVRRALYDAATTRATIATIATDCGFSELGRFAGVYRAMFGEAPSATLRRYRRRDGPGPTEYQAYKG